MAHMVPLLARPARAADLQRHLAESEYVIKVEQNLVESTQNASARNRKRQPKDLETSRLESARSLHTERTHSRAKETAETACNA